MRFLKKLIIKLLEKSHRIMQDKAQKASVKCASVCNNDSLKSGFFCYNAMKYDVTYPILFFGVEFNVTKNRDDHLNFERITNDSRLF